MVAILSKDVDKNYAVREWFYQIQTHTAQWLSWHSTCKLFCIHTMGSQQLTAVMTQHTQTVFCIHTMGTQQLTYVKNFITKCHNWVFSTPTSYSKCPRFKPLLQAANPDRNFCCLPHYLQANAGTRARIMSRLLPSTTFSIHYFIITFPFNAIWLQLQ